MRAQFVISICCAALGAISLSASALAQQKTVKACTDEWRADKPANQAAGITQKDYVAKCRAGVATATPSETPKASRETGTSSESSAKTVKACTDEWRADKAANQAAGISEKDYVAKCRGAVVTSTAPSEAPIAPKAPVGTPAPSKPASPAASNEPTGAGQFATEAQARARCRGDTVVWVNTRSKVYHFSGNKNYGTTEHGAYMCEQDSVSAGMRAAKNETHP